jgi:hypothetical protein
VSATRATISKLLAWRPGGYLRASGALFGLLSVRTAAQTALCVQIPSQFSVNSSEPCFHKHLRAAY